eukprot:gb/GECH01011766.1/.p1 GENE.gb/GECH01011766.1/~~gb/GECH01011766.1/.p1  ORF type:complete len:385 (+),score=156.11 gb/GECH01011766.1/:1-1155(+)
MVLEATVICLDNSEYMRNGDYDPSRMHVQRDAANLLCGTKIHAHPENTVGILTMAGKNPNVEVALSSDLGKCLSAVSSTKIEGDSNLHSSLQVAQLALKHRQNKNQKQRIIAFVGSPVETEQKKLVRLGKKLKKNNVAVDIVNFGEESINTEKLEAFINAVNSNDNSHIVTVPPGPHILSDILLSSPIVEGEGGSAAGASGGASGDFVNEEEDPELAMALRLSLQESQRAEGEQGDESAPQQEQSQAQAQPSSGEGGVAPMDEDDDDLKRAIQMSMQESGGQSSQNEGDKQQEQRQQQEQQQAPMEQDFNEEEELKKAIQMSLAESEDQDDQKDNQQSTQQQDNQKDESIDEVLQDQEFLGNLVDSLKKGNNNKEQEKDDKDKE